MISVTVDKVPGNLYSPSYTLSNNVDIIMRQHVYLAYDAMTASRLSALDHSMRQDILDHRKDLMKV